MAYIGAGMCALSMTVAAWGVSQVWTTIISTVGRNPQVKKDVDIYGWAGFAEYFICCIQCVFIHFFDSYSEYPVQDGRG